MEDPSSSERVAAVRRDDDRESKSVCDRIGVDEKREHQHVYEGASGCGSDWACMFLFQGPYLHLTLTTTRLP